MWCGFRQWKTQTVSMTLYIYKGIRHHQGVGCLQDPVGASLYKTPEYVTQRSLNFESSTIQSVYPVYKQRSIWTHSSIVQTHGTECTLHVFVTYFSYSANSLSMTCRDRRVSGEKIMIKVFWLMHTMGRDHALEHEDNISRFLSRSFPRVTLSHSGDFKNIYLLFLVIVDGLIFALVFGLITTYCLIITWNLIP